MKQLLRKFKIYPSCSCCLNLRRVHLGIGNCKSHEKHSPPGVVPEKLHKFRRDLREGLIAR